MRTTVLLAVLLVGVGCAGVVAEGEGEGEGEGEPQAVYCERAVRADACFISALDTDECDASSDCPDGQACFNGAVDQPRKCADIAEDLECEFGFSVANNTSFDGAVGETSCIPNGVFQVVECVPDDGCPTSLAGECGRCVGGPFGD